ncbi:MAG: hypothetical protein IID18_00825 [Nitrospinae bacterium]|nr:hypothetical protein [Nitrospinota bacterium]
MPIRIFANGSSLKAQHNLSVSRVGKVAEKAIAGSRVNHRDNEVRGLTAPGILRPDTLTLSQTARNSGDVTARVVIENQLAADSTIRNTETTGELALLTRDRIPIRAPANGEG